MDFTLTEDQQAYMEAATAFANEALKPHAAHRQVLAQFAAQLEKPHGH